MRWFKNLKIGMKLALGFGVILVLLIFIALFASFTANNIDSIYSDVIDFPVERRANWVEVENRYNSIRSSVYHVGFDIGEETHEASSASLIEMYNSDFALINTAIDKIKQSLTNDKTLTADERARKIGEADGIIQSISQWRENLTDPMILALQAEDNAAAIKAYDENSSLSTDLMSKIESYRDESATVAADRNTATTAQSQQSIRLLLLLSAITAVLGIALAVIITRTIANPVKALVKTVNDVSEGKLEVSIDQSKIYKDEIGVLSASVSRLIGIILLIVSQLDKLNKDFQNGDIKANIDESLFKGSFKEVADGVNYMFSTMVGEILNFIDALNEFGKGNFDVKIANANGRTTVMVNTLDGLREHLTDVTNEINSLVNSAAIGQLDKRIDTKNFGGDWVILFDGLNALMEVISAPINEASEIMEKVAAGNFENKVTGNYQGAFLKIKESLNNTITNISSYIEEISAVLDKIAKNNLDQNISREYVGDFSDIKESLNNIIKTFNGIVSNILMAAEQVSSGSTSVSEGSMSLAEGATEQAASIQELNATVQLINSNTVRNAENAENANSLSVQSKESASQGETEMKKMLHSMERIKESSSGISKIMKVIDDIAFQTNLLALNAAVEAARAGEYGKGFAVVAQEVRTLAERSKSNANETYRLIEESITRINEGMEIARNTDTSLGLIVESVSKVNDIIAGISTSSQEQASAISQVTEGIQQIAEVIQGNSATSEETASAAQELSGQAEMLKGLVEVFTLKRENK